jgi:hypothetical protein
VSQTFEAFHGEEFFNVAGLKGALDLPLLPLPPLQLGVCYNVVFELLTVVGEGGQVFPTEEGGAMGTFSWEEVENVAGRLGTNSA